MGEKELRRGAKKKKDDVDGLDKAVLLFPPPGLRASERARNKPNPVSHSIPSLCFSLLVLCGWMNE